MQNKGFVKVFAVLLTLVCMFYLSFSFVTRHYNSKAAEYAGGDPVKESSYLDSLSTQKVWLGYTLKECREMEISLGLDLKGGMNVVLELNVADVIRSLSNNNQDENFNKALDLAYENQVTSQKDFIDLFAEEYKKLDNGARLSAIFSTFELKDKITPQSSDAQVIAVLKEELKSAIDNSFNVLRTRIDRFGVVSPNIQRLETAGRILVELPGVKEPERVRKLLQGSANLEFWETYNLPEIYQQLVAAYNIFASVLRALGNSRTPLIAMLIASVINVVLDLVFVAGLHWGVAGAALATVTAQAFSALYCFVVVKKIDIVHTSRSDFEHVPGLNRKLLGLGAPILFQDVIISVGGLAVQFVINGYGFLFVAGFTATNKLYGVLEMAAISYGYAVVSYVGQNLGAGKIGRIKKGVHSSAFLAFLTSAFISIMMFLFGKTLLSMFISGDPAQTEQVLAIAWHYLSIMASCLCILYFLYVYRSALQGLGNTMIPMLSGVVEFFVRVGVALLLPKLVGQNGIFYAEKGRVF